VGVQDLAASDLMGATVHGTNDETIGDVGDIVFNKDGTIDAVVVDVGGFLGMGEKPVALSFDSLQTRLDDSGNLIVAVAASKDELQNAPTYDESAK
jgi:sporulation protein YlmC with PRC-barrel domain